MSGDGFTAEVLEAGARSYASFAASALLERAPEASRFGPDALARWQDQLTQAALDLASALRFGEPGVFASKAAWLRQAFEARDVPVETLEAALTALRETLDAELPERARGAASRCLDSAIASLRSNGQPVDVIDPSSAHGGLALRYLTTLLEGDRRAAMDLVIGAVDGGMDVRDAYMGVLLPAQEQIGRMWHVDEVNIAEEHFITETTRTLMSVLTHRLAPAPASDAKTVLAATVTGNVHDVAVRAVADFFALEGWKVVYLGVDVPPADLARATAYFGADLLAISATLPTQLRAVQETIEQTRRVSGGDRTKALVGGLAFRGAPGLWEKVGADGYARSAREAVAEGARLVGGS